MAGEEKVGFIEVDGGPISYSDVGEGEQSILLVHGSGAHRLWWHHVTPALAPDYRVVAIDMSGHGDSARREEYGPHVFARDVNSVAEQLGLERCVLAGHSLGGRVSLAAAGTAPGLYEHLLVMDTVLSLGQPSMPRRQSLVAQPMATAEDLAMRFRFLPPQPLPDEEIMAPVIEYSMIETEDGWLWKLDGAAITYGDDGGFVNDQIPNIDCPITFAWANESVLDCQPTIEFIRQSHPDMEVIEVAGEHHFPLDHPQSCIDLLQQVMKRADELAKAR